MSKNLLILCLLVGIISISSGAWGTSHLGKIWISNRQDVQTPRWYIYQDDGSPLNHGDWTNYMPQQGSRMIRLTLSQSQNPASGSTAIKFIMDLEINPYWCGIVAGFDQVFGQNPSDLNVGYNLSRFKRLVFWARGEKGDERIQIKVAITGNEPYGDSARSPAETKWLPLSKEWQEYSLDVSNIDLKRVITPFVVVSSRAHNETNPITFYLDEIYFDMGDRR